MFRMRRLELQTEILKSLLYAVKSVEAVKMSQFPVPYKVLNILTNCTIFFVE